MIFSSSFFVIDATLLQFGASSITVSNQNEDPATPCFGNMRLNGSGSLPWLSLVGVDPTANGDLYTSFKHIHIHTDDPNMGRHASRCALGALVYSLYKMYISEDRHSGTSGLGVSMYTCVTKGRGRMVHARIGWRLGVDFFIVQKRWNVFTVFIDFLHWLVTQLIDSEAGES